MVSRHVGYFDLIDLYSQTMAVLNKRHFKKSVKLIILGPRAPKCWDYGELKAYFPQAAQLGNQIFNF